MISSWYQYVVNISHCINCESVWRLFPIEFKAHAPQKIWWSSFDIGNSTSQAQDFYVQMSSHPCKPPMLQPARVASMARWKGGPPRRFGWQPWSTECCCFFSWLKWPEKKWATGCGCPKTQRTQVEPCRVRHDLHPIGFCWHNEPLRSAHRATAAAATAGSQGKKQCIPCDFLSSQ